MAKERIIEVGKATDIELAQILGESYTMLMKLKSQIALTEREVNKRLLELDKPKKKEK
jgi:plasmid maintenance system antidote protein VapI